LHNTSELVIDRCALKDDIEYGKLDSAVFNDALEQQTTSNNSYNTATAYDNYNQLNVRELLSNVLINQKDHSNNELESYEGEMYLPNLINEVGEEAPIQPLMYQNTKEGTERFASKSIIIDSGDNSKLILTTATDNTPAPVTNLGTTKWSKFRVNLQETFKIEKLCDIYVRNFTIIGATTASNCLYFAVRIEELNTLKPSNNRNIKDKIIFRNTNYVTVNSTDIVAHTFPYRSYYVASTNPQTFFNLNIELTNENGNTLDDGAGNTFKNNVDTNRIILELEFIPREKPNEIIFDRTPYGSALNAELSNT
jgi:hypothetical protein